MIKFRYASNHSLCFDEEGKENENAAKCKIFLRPNEQIGTTHTFKREGIKNAAQCIKTISHKYQKRLACKAASGEVVDQSLKV